MPSLRAAVNEKCRECIYDPIAAGAWRAQVEACPSRACPLWEVRPVSTAGPNQPNLGADAPADGAK